MVFFLTGMAPLFRTTTIWMIRTASRSFQELPMLCEELPNLVGLYFCFPTSLESGAGFSHWRQFTPAIEECSI